jgi:hypothetical protein
MGACFSREYKAVKNNQQQQQLQAAFDDFVIKHCLVGPEFYTHTMKMQSAIMTYIKNIGLIELITEMRLGEDIFDFFGKEFVSDYGIYKTGVIAYPVLVGVQITSWPHIKNINSLS